MQKSLGVALLVLLVALTPSWVDVYQAWNVPQEIAPNADPHTLRTSVLLWFLFVFFIAYSFGHLL